ncbi:MAG: efflux RND transporter periplasmic adaptor subunit [Betaproteobacteria bacterium]|nr:efflux RND transporter periplasmic adaptor subunit [Betaproteobacteria bacterium]MDH4326736.1 efflux RND transporter periplasmic adaptor subunit [Betaproteobacteria bacterium]MDH5210693.1 efflux RND transporter periplasmic adaptor subunit [Betaproteobacteria bacterium]MDH5577627.1 efflux RND transporter periplasmic adaptor subunit [Betaproteobacteria bacterium]
MRLLRVCLLSCSATLLGASVQGTAGATQLPGEYDCLIEARQSIDMRSPVEGIIESVLVQRGELVKKGALVAKLSSGPERAALDLARSRARMEGELKSAEARVGLARKKWERADELQRQNFVSANARDEAEAEYRLAIEQLRAARENRRLAELDAHRAQEVLDQRSIRSPVNGVVVEIMLRPGELMSSNQKDPIMTIVEIDPLNVELLLPVSQFGRVKVGQLAEVRPEEPVGGMHPARVEVVDRVLDAASGTFGVRLRLPNPGGRIPAGVKCRVRF